MWFVDVGYFVVVFYWKVSWNEYMLYFICQFYFVVQVFLFQLVFKQMFIFDGYCYDIGNSGNELYFFVYIVIIVEIVDEYVSDRFFFMQYWNDQFKS